MVRSAPHLGHFNFGVSEFTVKGMGDHLHLPDEVMVIGFIESGIKFDPI